VKYWTLTHARFFAVAQSPQADGFCLTGFDWGIKWKKSKQKQMGVSKNGGYQLAQNILLFNLMFETS
jgi:hypothetical protein